MRSVGNTPYFRPPKARQNEGKRMLVISLLTAFIPPFGLICLWRGSRYQMSVKVLLSILGLVSMTVMFSLYLSQDIPKGVEVPVDYKYLSATSEPTPAPTAPAPETSETPAPVETAITGEASETDELDDLFEDMVPANPAG